MWRTPSIEFDCCLGNLGQLRWRFFGDRGLCRQRLTDRAKLAGSGAISVAHAGLQHRRGQHVSTM
jgi:hypothetical protein